MMRLSKIHTERKTHTHTHNTDTNIYLTNYFDGCNSYAIQRNDRISVENLHKTVHLETFMHCLPFSFLKMIMYKRVSLLFGLIHFFVVIVVGGGVSFCQKGRGKSVIQLQNIYLCDKEYYYCPLVVRSVYMLKAEIGFVLRDKK